MKKHDQGTNHPKPLPGIVMERESVWESGKCKTTLHFRKKSSSWPQIPRLIEPVKYTFGYTPMKVSICNYLQIVGPFAF